MCGGQSTRFDATVEKPLYELGGRPMIDHVGDALADSGIATVYPVVSPHTPETRAYVDDPVIEAPGAGYVDDLASALEDDRIDQPVVTVAADIPLITPAHVDDLIDGYAGTGVAVCVPRALKQLMGLSMDEPSSDNDKSLVPTGLNVVARASCRYTTSYDARLAVNVNRLSDAHIAEALL